MQFSDLTKPNLDTKTFRPTEIDGYPVIYRPDGSIEVDRPMDEEFALAACFVPAMVYLIEKWGFAPVVIGANSDDCLYRRFELGIYHCNQIHASQIFDGMYAAVCPDAPILMSGVKLAVNPETREPILTLEQAEHLDLTGYMPPQGIQPPTESWGSSESFVGLETLLAMHNYRSPAVIYQYGQDNQVVHSNSPAEQTAPQSNPSYDTYPLEDIEEVPTLSPEQEEMLQKAMEEAFNPNPQKPTLL